MANKNRHKIVAVFVAFWVCSFSLCFVFLVSPYFLLFHDILEPPNNPTNEVTGKKVPLNKLSEQILLGSRLMSQGSRQKFAWTSRKSLCIAKTRNAPSAAGNSMGSSERPSPEPILKKEAGDGDKSLVMDLWFICCRKQKEVAWHLLIRAGKQNNKLNFCGQKWPVWARF